MPLRFPCFRLRSALGLLVTSVLLSAGSPAAHAQFGYSSATPQQATATVSVKARITFAAGTDVRFAYSASTSRDGAGVASGSSVLFKFEEGYFSRMNNYYAYADAYGICTDYDEAGAGSCRNGWQNATQSATSKVVTFPTVAAGADVTPRLMAVRVGPRLFNSLGQSVATSASGIVTMSYFLTPPADAFYRDGSGNEVAIWRQRAVSVGTQLNRPLVIAEGIDLGDAAEVDEYFGQLGPLANTVRAGGYDIALVSFGNPLQSIRIHQAGFQSALRLVHGLKQDPAKKTAVMGLSRGGVVARYALAKMEETGIAHNASLFISYDSPQRGANVNKDLQRIVFESTATDAGAVALKAQLKSDAVRELLQDRFSNADLGVPNDNKFTTMYQELAALNGGAGYPTQVRKVAWSNGGWQVPVYTNNTFVEVDAYASGRDETALLTSFDRLAGSFLPKSFQNIVDGKTGNAASGWLQVASVLGSAIVQPLTLFTQTFGDFYRITVYSEPTFIPTASALDQNNANASTPFNRVASAPSRSSHDAVPQEAVLMILQELGLYTPPQLTASINGPSTLTPGQMGTWTAGYANGSGSPTYRWEYKLYMPNCGVLNVNDGTAASKMLNEGTAADISSMEVTCGEPYLGGTSSTWSRSVSTNARLEITLEVRVGGSLATARKTVTIGSGTGGGGGGELPLTGALTNLVVDEKASGVTGESEKLPSDASSLFAGTAESGQVNRATGIWPNPMRDHGRLGLELTESAHLRVRVYDAVGRLVSTLADETARAGRHEFSLDVRELPAGTYIYRAEAGRSVTTGTFVVSR